jgi:2-keto-4-pentenoate hydratase/2-oxohepta-3-ene-1,7-dioic acid hydratase in catechol pathway
MKFCTAKSGESRFVGLLNDDGTILNLTSAWRHHARGADDAPPVDLIELIERGEPGLNVVASIAAGSNGSCRTALKDVTILAPFPRPRRNVFCVGRNYREHIIEGNLARGRDPNDFPKLAEFFTKAPTTVIGDGAAIPLHAGITKFLDYEVEMGVVIGKRGINISVEAAMDYVFGYTIINDITARDVQLAHGQWFKGKSLDGTCPMGPVVAHRLSVSDPHALEISLDVNGERRQDASTRDLLFKVPEIINQLSKGMTLEAGDVIATGTPSGVGLGLNPQIALKSGDRIVARLQAVGELRNVVA